MPIKCLLIDCDGTLVDSETLLAEVLAEVFCHSGLPFTATEYMQNWRGVVLDRILTAVAKAHRQPLPFAQLSAIEQEVRRRTAERMRTSLLAMPGAMDTLSVQPHTLAVVSNGPLAKIQLALDATGLRSFFAERIFSAHELQLFKPDPLIFLESAARLGFVPAECAVIEDSPAGLSAALAAGMHVIHYNRFPEQEPTPTGAIMLNAWSDLNRVIETLA
ncbi:HAD family hydrolase [Oceanisphaera sp.]|uniref:HAD family hydrolase n=1 Tax=Oceanisphaera sp. TaxID=1929979 RepID=UPI003A9586F3